RSDCGRGARALRATARSGLAHLADWHGHGFARRSDSSLFAMVDPSGSHRPRICAGCLSPRLWTGTVQGMGVSSGPVMGHVSSPRLFAGQSGVLALGLGRLGDLSAADAATNCTQSRIATPARAAGSVPSGGAIPGEFGTHQVPARPRARPAISTYRVQVTMRVAYLINQYPAVSHAFIRREIQA